MKKAQEDQIKKAQGYYYVREKILYVEPKACYYLGWYVISEDGIVTYGLPSKTQCLWPVSSDYLNSVLNVSQKVSSLVLMVKYNDAVAKFEQALKIKGVRKRQWQSDGWLGRS